MSVSALQPQIEQYVEHLGEECYWRSMLTAFSAIELMQTLVLMLKDESDQAVSAACLFIRDLVLSAPEEGARRPFLDRFHESDIVTTLETLLSSPSLFKREAAVYTLGKTCCRESVGRMKDVMLEIKDTDPVLLPSLASEIRWLEKEGFLGWVVEHLLQSPSRMTRWATLDILNFVSPEAEDDGWGLKYQALESLCNDADLNVKECARFQKDEMEFERSLPEIGSRTEKRRLRKQLEKRRPQFFEFIALRFRNEMYQSGKSCYSAGDLETFAAQRGDGS